MTDKDNAKKEIEWHVNYFMSEIDENYNVMFSKVLTETEYCDIIVNEVQKQLLAWVSERQNKYGE